MSTGSERSHGKRGAKGSRWTRQEAVEEAELLGLGEGEAKATSGESGVGGSGLCQSLGLELCCGSFHSTEMDRSLIS